MAPWVPVIVDLTPHVRAGKTYTLVIKVKGRNKYRHERIAMQYDWTSGGFLPAKSNQWMVPQAAAWLEDIAEGIIRGANMLILPAVHLSEPYIVTSIAKGLINPYVKLNNIGDKPIQGVVRARLCSASDQGFAYPKLPEIPFTLDANDTRRFDLTATVWGLGRESFWWPNVPYRKGYRCPAQPGTGSRRGWQGGAHPHRAASASASSPGRAIATTSTALPATSAATTSRKPTSAPMPMVRTPVSASPLGNAPAGPARWITSCG